MNCKFCGSEIKDGDKWFSWWSHEDMKNYKICLKCVEKINNL